MNYIGRKDGGKYIPSQKEEKKEVNDPYLLVPIAYDKTIAELCSKTGQSYRSTYIEYIREANK